MQDISDLPPNPNQQPSNPLLVPRSKFYYEILCIS